MGKNISLWGLKSSLSKPVEEKESFMIRYIDNGYFIVSFKNESDLNYACFEGPWMVANHYLIVQR